MKVSFIDNLFGKKADFIVEVIDANNLSYNTSGYEEKQGKRVVGVKIAKENVSLAYPTKEQVYYNKKGLRKLRVYKKDTDTYVYMGINEKKEFEWTKTVPSPKAQSDLRKQAAKIDNRDDNVKAAMQVAIFVLLVVAGIILWMVTSSVNQSASLLANAAENGIQCIVSQPPPPIQ